MILGAALIRGRRLIEGGAYFEILRFSFQKCLYVSKIKLNRGIYILRERIFPNISMLLRYNEKEIAIKLSFNLF